MGVAPGDNVNTTQVVRKQAVMYVCVNRVALLRCIWIAKKVRNIL